MSTIAANQTPSISHVARISRSTWLYEIFLHSRRLQPTMGSLAAPESNLACVSHLIVAGASRQRIGSFLNYNNSIAGISLGILNIEYKKQINMKMRIHSQTGRKLPPNTAFSGLAPVPPRNMTTRHAGCTGRLGVCALLRQFLGFESIRPLACPRSASPLLTRAVGRLTALTLAKSLER